MDNHGRGSGFDNDENQMDTAYDDILQGADEMMDDETDMMNSNEIELDEDRRAGGLLIFIAFFYAFRAWKDSSGACDGQSRYH